MLFAGIDPGWSGSVALVDEHGAHVESHGFAKLTEVELVRVVYDVVGRADFAIVEKVGAMPGQGLSSTFKFGQALGLARAALSLSGTPWEAVAPGVWQQKLGCLCKGDKNVLVQKAQQLWPNETIRKTGARGVADGVLLAEYARRIRLGL